MENKKLSVIIIGNNNIDECLELIYKQSYIKDMELIVLYKNAVEQLKEKYTNVKFLNSKNNIFLTLRENKELIKGDFIAILNDEDCSSIDYYRCMINKAISENADVVMSNVVLQYNDGGKAFLNLMESTFKDLDNEEILNEYLKQEGIAAFWSIYGNKVFSKEVFFKAIEKLCKYDEHIQEFYALSVLYKYCKKLRLVNNEFLFYSIEKERSLDCTKAILNNNVATDEVTIQNINKNFDYLADFLKEMQLYERYKEELENWKKLYTDEIEIKKMNIVTKIKTAWNDKLDKIKREILKENTKVVSFDIFDTLIMRPFWNPIDLFTFLNDYFRELTNTETGIDFSKIRVRAEERVRYLILKNKIKQDMTLDDIYSEIANEGKIDNEIITKMEEKEKELEIRFCSPRNTGKELYELAKYLNKKVICITDMYLPKQTIEQMLTKNGYDVKNIYISGEIELTKHSGDLYDFVLKDLNIEPNTMVHIGDNYYADYENSVKKGINGQFLAKAIDVFCDENITNNLGKLFKQNLPVWEDNTIGLSFLGIRCMLAVVANKYFDNPYRTFNNLTDFNADSKLVGYYALGMNLFGMSDWLLKETNEKYDKIVFCARDGYWTMQAYKILKNVYKNVPEEKYLYISRKALIPATLQNRFDFYKLAELIDIYKYTPKTILKYIKSVLKNIDSLEEICSKSGIDVNKKFETQSEFNLYIKLIIDKFYDKEKHERLLNALKQYFSKIFEGKSCIFDIGYSAKPEMYLSKLINKPIDTYFINVNGGDAFNHAKIGGFKLTNYLDYRPAIIGVVREIFMSTPDPSCIAYNVDENDVVTPVFEERKVKYQERFVIDAMQKAAIGFIKDMVSIFKNDMETLYYQKYYVSLPHEMYIHSANELDQEILRGIALEDSVGLGDEIDAVKEWNREIKTKNQVNSSKIFEPNILLKLENKIKELTNENEIIKSRNEAQREELQNIYNSKRWKYFDKLNKLLGRK